MSISTEEFSLRSKDKLNKVINLIVETKDLNQ